jgi:alkaline phosphatase
VAASLPQLASAALAVLDRYPRGFFVLLESEDTDELSHGNDTLPRLVAGMRELDATVRVALEYQARHQKR